MAVIIIPQTKEVDCIIQEGRREMGKLILTNAKFANFIDSWGLESVYFSSLESIIKDLSK